MQLWLHSAHVPDMELNEFMKTMATRPALVRYDAALHCRNDNWTNAQLHSKQPTILQSV